MMKRMIAVAAFFTIVIGCGVLSGCSEGGEGLAAAPGAQGSGVDDTDGGLFGPTSGCVDCDPAATAPASPPRDSNAGSENSKGTTKTLKIMMPEEVRGGVFTPATEHSIHLEFEAEGGSGEYAWDVEGLPASLEYSGDGDQMTISGEVSSQEGQDEIYKVKVIVSDAAGNEREKRFKIVVKKTVVAQPSDPGMTIADECDQKLTATAEQSNSAPTPLTQLSGNLVRRFKIEGGKGPYQVKPISVIPSPGGSAWFPKGKIEIAVKDSAVGDDNALTVNLTYTASQNLRMSDIEGEYAKSQMLFVSDSCRNGAIVPLSVAFVPPTVRYSDVRVSMEVEQFASVDEGDRISLYLLNDDEDLWYAEYDLFGCVDHNDGRKATQECHAPHKFKTVDDDSEKSVPLDAINAVSMATHDSMRGEAWSANVTKITLRAGGWKAVFFDKPNNIDIKVNQASGSGDRYPDRNWPLTERFDGYENDDPASIWFLDGDGSN